MARVFLVVGLAVLGVLCWRFGLGDLATAWQRLSPGSLLVYAACGCAARLGYSLRWRLVAQTLGGSPPLAQLVAARLGSDAVGLLLPAGRLGGDPVRIALTHAAGGGAVRTTAGVAIDRLMEVIGNMCCAMAYVTVFSFAHAFGASQRAATILVVSMCLLLGALAVPLTMLRHGSRPLSPLYTLALRFRAPRVHVWLDALHRTEGHLMGFFRDHPGTFVWGLLVSLLIEGLVIVEYHFLFAAFAVTVDLPTLLLMLVASGLVRAVPVPAGLGALEAGQVAVLAVASGRPDVGFVAGLVMRLHETLWAAAGIAVLSLRGVSLARLRPPMSAGTAAV